MKAKILIVLLVIGVVGAIFFVSRGEQEEPTEEFVSIPIGMSIFPRGELSEWTDQGFTEAFQKAKEGGISVAIWRHQWGEIETSLENYNWNDIDYEIYKTEQHGLKYSLVIEIIHTNSLGKYPQGISFTKFDDSSFIDAFKSFVRVLLDRYSGEIDYLWIGNEVDLYLHNSQEQIVPFVNFYQEIEEEIKSIDSNITVGIVGTYHEAKNNDETSLLQDFAEEGDAIALTLYMEFDHTDPAVSSTEIYFDELMNLFPNTKVAIVETAWSSRGPKGSEENQTEYVKEISRVIEKYENKFVFFSWFTLYDIPEQLNREIAKSFGVPLDTDAGQQFLDWQGSLGLLNNNGTEKPAWNAWKEYLSDFRK
jgi:hypothetical protein